MFLRRFSAAVVSAIGLFLPSFLSAQSPRVTLIEEVTSASCISCGLFRAGILNTYNRPEYEGKIIPIAWHSSVSGKDKINEENPAMHNGRIAYYGGIKPPSFQVNGNIPANLAQLASAIPTSQTISPITINLEQTQTDQSISARVTVSSIEELSSATLYITVIEGYHYATNIGTNERQFYYIARRMLPTNEGSPISLSAGGSVTVTPEAIQLDPTWEDRFMYVVAWVQNDATKEVLQAASTRGRLIPHGEEPRAGAATANESPAEWQLPLDPTITGTCTLKISRNLPKGWKANVYVDGNEIMDSTTSVSAVAGTTSTIRLVVIPSINADKRRDGSITLSFTGPRDLQFSRTFRLYSRNVDVLLLFRDKYSSVDQAYTGILNLANTYSYATIHQADEDLFDPRDHVTLMAFGKSSTTAQDIQQLQTKLDAGGMRLFITGGEIGFCLVDPGNTEPLFPHDENFLRNYLHASYVRDKNPSGTVWGVADDPLSDNMKLRFTSDPNSGNTPDEIVPITPAIPTFYYDSARSEVAGLRYADGVNRLLYLAFGAEYIGEYSERTALFQKGIEWLLGDDLTTGTEEMKEASPFLSETIRPVPATEFLDIDIQIPIRSRITIRLYDIMGREVLPATTGVYEAGTQRERIDVAGIAPGIYTLVVEREEGKTFHKVNVKR